VGRFSNSTPVTDDILEKERSKYNIRMVLPCKRRVCCPNSDDRNDAFGGDSVDDFGALLIS
jgi:hypothetical protein